MPGGADCKAVQGAGFLGAGLPLRSEKTSAMEGSVSKSGHRTDTPSAFDLPSLEWGRGVFSETGIVEPSSGPREGSG